MFCLVQTTCEKPQGGESLTLTITDITSHKHLECPSGVRGLYLAFYFVVFGAGDGSQTRSFQYVDDLVRGLMALMNGDYNQPVNIGNPDEYTVKDFAKVR